MTSRLEEHARTGHICYIMDLFEDKTCNSDDVAMSLVGAAEVSLVSAAACGKIETVRYLVELGCRMNQVDDKGNTPFHAAALKSHTVVLRYLLQKRGEIRKELRSAIDMRDVIADFGHETITENKEKIDNLRSQLLIFKNYKGQSPLMIGVENGHVSVVKLLLKHRSGDDVDMDIGSDDCRALNLLFTTAAHSGDESMMYELLKPSHGINPDLMDDKGKTALGLAVENGQEGAVQILLRNKLVDKEFNSKVNPGWTPVHIAAMNGKLGPLKLLVESGCNISPRGNNGETPLLSLVKEVFKTEKLKKHTPHWKMSDYMQIIEYLVKMGCDLEVQDKKGHNVVSVVISEVEAGAHEERGIRILRCIFEKGYDMADCHSSTNINVQALIDLNLDLRL